MQRPEGPLGEDGVGERDSPEVAVEGGKKERKAGGAVKEVNKFKAHHIALFHDFLEIAWQVLD